MLIYVFGIWLMTNNLIVMKDINNRVCRAYFKSSGPYYFHDFDQDCSVVVKEIERQIKEKK